MKKICRSVCSVLFKQLIFGYNLLIKACILLVFVLYSYKTHVVLLNVKMIP